MGRKYSNISKTMSLTTSIGISDVVIIVNDATGLPITFPYNLALEIDTANIEIVLVTSATSNNLTVSRGQEDTPARPHSTGATATHVATALDFQDMVNHIEGTTNVHGVGAGNALVGTGSTQTLTNKTMSGASNTFSNIPGSAIANSPVFHNAIIDNAAATTSPALITETLSGSTASTQLVRVRNGATAIEIVPGDGTVTTGNFINAQDLGSVSKFKVTRAGDITTAGTIVASGTGLSSLAGALTTKNLTVTQGDAAAVGLDVVPNASPTAPAARVTSHTAQPGMQIKRNSSVTTGANMFEIVDELNNGLLTTTRTGDLSAFGSITSLSTVKGTDFTIAGSPDRSVKTELDDLTAAWTTWVPTLTNLTLGNGAVTARYHKVGKTLNYRFKFVLGSTSAVGTTPRFTLPFAVHASYAVNEDVLGWGMLLDTGTTNRAGLAEFFSSTALTIRLTSSTGSFGDITATAPWTWGTGDALSISGTIELA